MNGFIFCFYNLSVTVLVFVVVETVKLFLNFFFAEASIRIRIPSHSGPVFGIEP